MLFVYNDTAETILKTLDAHQKSKIVANVAFAVPFLMRVGVPDGCIYKREFFVRCFNSINMHREQFKNFVTKYPLQEQYSSLEFNRLIDNIIPLNEKYWKTLLSKLSAPPDEWE